MIALEQFRLDVAHASERLKNGEPPQDVPCPKCRNSRYIEMDTLGKLARAACSCCGFHWILA